jgi:hypothetical protein
MARTEQRLESFKARTADRLPDGRAGDLPGRKIGCDRCRVDRLDGREGSQQTLPRWIGCVDPAETPPCIALAGRQHLGKPLGPAQRIAAFEKAQQRGRGPNSSLR